MRAAEDRGLFAAAGDDGLGQGNFPNLITSTPTGRSIFISRRSPGNNEEGNWLPAPKGSFNLTTRLYAPKSEY
jgi:hypothetical protein